jgi:hypothetical protein
LGLGIVENSHWKSPYGNHYKSFMENNHWK